MKRARMKIKVRPEHNTKEYKKSGGKEVIFEVDAMLLIESSKSPALKDELERYKQSILSKVFVIEYNVEGIKGEI